MFIVVYLPENNGWHIIMAPPGGVIILGNWVKKYFCYNGGLLAGIHSDPMSGQVYDCMALRSLIGQQ